MDEWSVNLADDDQRTLTTAEVVDGYQQGWITADTYVWRDGMADWAPLADVPELCAALSGGAPPSQPGWDGGAAAAGYAAHDAAQAPGSQPGWGAPEPAPGSHPGSYEAPAPSSQGYEQQGYEQQGYEQQGYDPAYGAAGAGAGAQDVETMVAPAGFGAAASDATAPTALRKPGRGNVDLFGAPSERAPSVPPPSVGGFSSANIGERNENSMLFSLSSLKATEEAMTRGASSAAPKSVGRAAPPVRRASLDIAGSNSRGGIDDIMNLGSGMSAAPSLAPPPMNAPYIEPPPPPPPSVPQPMAGPASGPMSAAMAMPASFEYPQRKNMMPIFIGGGIGLIGLFALVFALVRGGGDDEKTAKLDEDKANAAERDDKSGSSKSDKDADKADDGDKADGDKADGDKADGDKADGDKADGDEANATAKSDDKDGDADKKPDSSKATAALTNRTAPVTDTKSAAAKKEEPKKEEPKATTAAKKEEPKKEEPVASATGKFDRGAAQAAVGSAAGSARGCKKDGGPTGSGRVSVTFAPSGAAAGVNVEPPFGGTSVGNCIAGIFKGLRVPAFSGSPVTVSKTVIIR